MMTMSYDNVRLSYLLLAREPKATEQREPTRLRRVKAHRALMREQEANPFADQRVDKGGALIASDGKTMETPVPPASEAGIRSDPLRC